MMNSATVVTLPGGLWLEGKRHQEAGLRPLAGDDEAFLIEEGAWLLPAQRVTTLLGRCLTGLGPIGRVSTEMVRSLTVGDREALLLHLRRLTLGERLQGVLGCPAAECGERMDLELAVSELLLPPYPHPQQWHETTIAENGTTCCVRFRLPTGADQEVAASLATRDPQAAADLILHRCVESVSAGDDNTAPIEDWPSIIADHLPALMAELDPQAELALPLICPACGHAFTAILDMAAYFFRELAGRTQHLYREVHALAFYYHWSEAEIMSMTARKRQRYLDLLAEALAGEESR